MPTFNQIKAAMKELPPKESSGNRSVKAQIYGLSEEIRELHFDKNWSWSDIAGWLGENGIKIAESTLKIYYGQSVSANASTVTGKSKPKATLTPPKPKTNAGKTPSATDPHTPPPPPPPSLSPTAAAFSRRTNPVLE